MKQAIKNSSSLRVEENKLKQIVKKLCFPVLWLREKYLHSRNKWLAKHNPKRLAGIKYKSVMKQKMDWNNPQDLNAKIQWLKFYGDISLWARCADKYAVRQYVEEKGLGGLLVKLYGKWNCVEDVDWDSLPNKFILKMNNGSGDAVICQDKTKMNISSVISQFKKLFDVEYGIMSVEPHYSKIKPCIIAEELLDATKQDIKSDSLIDYKVWCFNGEPLYIWVCHNRSGHEVQVATFDINWVYKPEKSVFNSSYKESSVEIPKPKCLPVMINAASILSKGHSEVRVDFYVVDDQCYFGEMTFTSLGGYMNFYTREMLLEMGQKTDLSLVRK